MNWYCYIIIAAQIAALCVVVYIVASLICFMFEDMEG